MIVLDFSRNINVYALHTQTYLYTLRIASNQVNHVNVRKANRWWDDDDDGDVDNDEP